MSSGRHCCLFSFDRPTPSREMNLPLLHWILKLFMPSWRAILEQLSELSPLLPSVNALRIEFMPVYPLLWFPWYNMTKIGIFMIVKRTKRIAKLFSRSKYKLAPNPMSCRIGGICLSFILKRLPMLSKNSQLCSFVFFGWLYLIWFYNLI